MKKIISLFIALLIIPIYALAYTASPVSKADDELVLQYVQGDNYYTFKYGFSDKTGKIIIPLTYDYAEPFSCGYALVCLGEKIYFIDKNNAVAFNSNKSEYSFYSSFREDLCVASKNGKFGFLDRYGAVAIDFIYDDAYNFSEGLACVYKNGKAGFIDKNGETVIDFIYDSADRFKGGYAKVSRGGRFGFIKKDGSHATAIMYERAADFSEGVACVRISGKYTFVDTNGFIYFPPIFEEAKSFKNGSALVRIEKKYGRIKKDGFFRIEPVFDYMSEFEGDYAVGGKYVCEGIMRYGFIDMDGNRVTPMVYEKIRHYDGIYHAVLNGKTFYFNEKLEGVEKPLQSMF